MWIKINKNEFYEVNEFGEVRSIDREIEFKNKKGKIFLKGKNLKLLKDKKGYIRVNLKKNQKCINAQVHRLVAEAFIPNPENKPFVNHINGIKDDNRVENLEWVTPSENNIHAVLNNLIKKKLNKDDILEIRNNPIYLNMKIKDIAKKFNVHSNTICSIIHNSKWKHLGESKNVFIKRKNLSENEKENLIKLLIENKHTIKELSEKFSVTKKTIHFYKSNLTTNK